MTLRLFDVRLWLVAMLALAAIVGNGWVNDQAQPEQQHGFYLAPKSDCGSRWDVWLFLPGGPPCLRGSISQDKLDKLSEERNIPDLPAHDALVSFRELLSDIAKSWGIH